MAPLTSSLGVVGSSESSRVGGDSLVGVRLPSRSLSVPFSPSGWRKGCDSHVITIICFGYVGVWQSHDHKRQSRDHMW